MLRVIALRLVGPVVLSSLGPIHYGQEGAPYTNVIIWALACTAIFLWWTRSSFQSAFNSSDVYWFKSALAGSIMAVIAVGFIAGNSVAYLLARSLSN
jgi:hypothetical protein